MDEYSVIINNARIVDGTGKKAYKGSLGIKGEKVAAIGEVKGDAARVIDAGGAYALPGFIDSHSHGDFGIQYFPKSESYLFQGVTTMVAGQCGLSLAPIGDLIPLPGIASEYSVEIEPYKYYPKRTVFTREEVNALMKEKFGWTVNWHTMAEWYRAVEKCNISMNIATLVGHCTLRRTVMGDDGERAATNEEVAEMGALIKESMDAGCFGMSVGLDYETDVFAEKYELVEHCKIVAEYGGVFSPHSRRTGRRRGVGAGHKPQSKIDAILEVIELARKSGVKLNIAHLFTGWSVSPQGYPEILEEANRRATLQVLDDAIAEGIDVNFDLMPAGLYSKFHGPQYLCGSFEPWVREKGSRAEFAKWLRLTEYREEILDAIKQGKWFMRMAQNPNTNPSWAENLTILVHRNPDTVNKTLYQIIEERGKDAFDVWFDLLVEDPDAMVGYTFTYPGGPFRPEAPLNRILWAHPKAALGIDTGVTDYHHLPKYPPWWQPMILSFSAFPILYQRFVKEDKAFTIEEAVHKTSTRAADCFGLEGRGKLTPGSYADVVLMDLDKLKVMSTDTDPRRKPRGIEYVLVNGVVAIEKGEHTGATSGKVLRKKWGR
ncbi:amidohydrolase family protein [Candidatus Bathyarchaeota archaeon]|nr:amidohydrolase family protein [Candidatus Bathyarchaeota archaeon]